MVDIQTENGVATIWLNRPEKRNALNKEMINGIRESLQHVESNNDVRCVVLRGSGKVFCAGADINWMKDSAQFDYNQNLSDARLLADCFYKVYNCVKPVISLVHGSAIGGALGLIAASDIAIASHDTKFAFTEVKLGIIPSTIAPYVVRRIGEFRAKDLMISGRKIDGKLAEQFGLINRSVFISELDNALDEIVNEMRYNGPEAMNACKKLIADVITSNHWEALKEETSKNIADIRKTSEAKEGLQSFIEKRKPNWIKA